MITSHLIDFFFFVKFNFSLIFPFWRNSFCIHLYSVITKMKKFSHQLIYYFSLFAIYFFIYVFLILTLIYSLFKLLYESAIPGKFFPQISRLKKQFHLKKLFFFWWCEESEMKARKSYYIKSFGKRSLCWADS